MPHFQVNSVFLSIPLCPCIQVVDQLRGEQFHVAGLHSEKSQDLRFKIISAMKNGTHLHVVMKNGTHPVVIMLLCTM